MTKEDICRITGISIDKLENGKEMITLSGKEVDCLPGNLNIYGLTLENCPFLESLPEDLSIRYLSIQNCPNLTDLPKRLELYSLYLFDSNINEIPEKSLCWVELVLINCPNIRNIPQNTIGYAGDLYIENCPGITELPDIKIVYGNLGLAHTNIRSLPENLQIGGELWAPCSNIDEIPRTVCIGENICLSGNKNIYELPEDLKVNGYLSIEGTSIGKLPNNLIVKEWLDLRNTFIRELPENLIVCGDIMVNDFLSDAYIVKKDMPFDISEQLWKGTDYICIQEKLYKIVDEKDNCIKVMDAMMDIYRLQYGVDEVYDSNIFYVNKDNENPLNGYAF